MYENQLSLRDPRSDSWPLMSSIWPTTFICIAYVYIVKVGNNYVYIVKVGNNYVYIVKVGNYYVYIVKVGNNCVHCSSSCNQLFIAFILLS